MANSEIITSAAASLQEKISKVDAAIDALQLGGKSVIVGGTQYTQESLDQLQKYREKLTAQMRQLVRRASR